MLFPQTNQYRQVVDLSGFWDFRFDPDGIGEAQGWFRDLKESIPIAVPASWNNQFSDSRGLSRSGLVSDLLHHSLGLGWQENFHPVWFGELISPQSG